MPITRRWFLGSTLVASALAALPTRAGETAKPVRKVKLGLIGCGGRGLWIAKLFQKHGGYDVHALADYFPAVATTAGKELGVDEARRFSGLSGYQKVIASGVEALAIETPPYFMPEIAQAAVAAGLHVYMAKPVAVDVPGCQTILAAGQDATRRQRVFLVDYQMPTDPVNIELRQRILNGALGPLTLVETIGFCNGFSDPPLTATIESRLQRLIWVNDIALGCDYIGNFDIHALDAALWVLGRRPVAASGVSRIIRPNPHGDSRDVCQVVYEYADGCIHTHKGKGLGAGEGVLTAKFYGTQAEAELVYWGKSLLRGGTQAMSRSVENLYEAGASRNIAAFHEEVTRGACANATVPRAVDGCLITILGREAAARRVRLTMDDLLKENKKLAVNLTGLKT